MSTMPGPWEILYAGRDEGMTAAESIAEETPVVSVGPINYAEFANAGTEEERSNARLVAAAPELLEAARMTVAFLNGESHIYPLWAAEKAIAKATGDE